MCEAPEEEALGQGQREQRRRAGGALTSGAPRWAPKQPLCSPWDLDPLHVKGWG